MIGALERLLNQGALINAQDLKRRTPLMSALELACSLQGVKLLLSKGVDPTVKAHDGTTARDLAYRRAVAGARECNPVIEVRSNMVAPVEVRSSVNFRRPAVVSSVA